MKIATFNLENLSEAVDGGAALDARCRALRPYLVKLDADILCLQEVGAERAGPKGTAREFRALSALLEGTDYANFHEAHTVAKDKHGPLDVHNLMTLTRFPISSRRQYWNDLVAPPSHRFETPEGGAKDVEAVSWDRPVLHVEVECESGERLHVFNLHLKAPLAAFIPGQKIDQFKWRSISGWAEGFFVAAIKRSGQALEVRFAIDEIFDREPDALISLCGDMNSELNEMPLRILCGGESDTENPALGSRVMVALEEAVPESRRYSVIHGGRRIMLDHMLVSRALSNRFESVEIHNRNLTDELTDYRQSVALAQSHHAPIGVRFNF